MFISVPCHCLELLPLPLLPCPLVFSGTWLCLSSLIPASPASIDSFPSTSLVYTSDQPLSALLAPDKLLERILPHSMCLHPYHLPLWILGIWFQHWPFWWKFSQRPLVTSSDPIGFILWLHALLLLYASYHSWLPTHLKLSLWLPRHWALQILFLYLFCLPS